MIEQPKGELLFSKDQIVKRVNGFVEEMGYGVVEVCDQKPWGAYWRVNEGQIKEFVEDFFPNLKLEQLGLEQNLSPKLLLVAPGQRLSWQYHDRREEWWSVISGPVMVSRSKNDQEISPAFYFEDEVLKLNKGERHRLMAANGWGLVAEIWVHTDPSRLSDENDIVRLADDYER